ncbi:CaiB/BaiF CoA transferase family protein [Megasphaera hominis]|uniref:CoA transferase n=1 Tax=Megasphaera hominis TaxID=159836 RepID=A0ABR6VK02_9FIRM|nr:CoA transferase [Megasphaera hominis]MBC3537413.1 CoA transferase [Megasphaera hominis]
MATKALQDIVVLDLTRVLAGPYCTMMLADYGAKVIKIEIPGRGDDTRAFGPLKNGASMYYANVNRGKKGVTLNLKSDKGKEMFKQMVKKADVVVENYRPGVMDKMGVGYDVLKEVNPRIIYGAVSGFGCYGPDSKRPGYDIIAQATGGLMSITGEPGGHPLRVGNAMGDVLGGMNLTIGILMALHARELTGRGQRVDVALVDSVVSSLEIGIQRFFASGKQPELMGNRYASAYPYDSFKAKDGLFVIGCGNDKLFTLLCNKVFKQPELLTDPRFETNLKRCENHAALKPIVEAWSSQYTIKEAVDMILAAGVPAAPINDLPHVTTDPHIAGAREMFVPLHHPVIGDMKVNGNPIKLMDTKLDISVPAPELGQDNAAVYGDLLGLDEAALKKLQEEKVI